MYPNSKLKDISERAKTRRELKPVKEDISKRTLGLKREIARFTTAVGVKILRSNGEELVKLNSALALLNQAQMIAEVSENEAKKLFAIARNIKSAN